MNRIANLAILFFFCLTSAFAEIQWSGIVIHHSDSDFGTVKDIDRWHKERGWDGIGYHYVIYRDGSIHKGRDLGKIGAHAKGRNQTYVGVCLIGKKSFTEAQKANLRHLCKELRLKYPILSIEHHHEECPGEGLEEEYFTEGGHK